MRKRFEEKRKTLLAATHGKLQLTLDEQEVCPGKPGMTKEWLTLPLFQLAVAKEEQFFPLRLEAMTLGGLSPCLGFETKRKGKVDRRAGEQTKRKNQMKLTN